MFAVRVKQKSLWPGDFIRHVCRPRLRAIGRGAILGGVSLITLVACTTTLELDLEGDRTKGLQEDMAVLKKVLDVTFDKPLTLQDVITVGLRNNLDIRVADFERDIAREDSFAERLKQLPRLDLKAEHTQRDSWPVTNELNVDTGQVTESTTVSQLKQNQTKSIELTWNVLDFGLSYVRARQAQLQVEVLAQRRQRQAQLLALDLTEAYWQAALAEDALDYVRQVEADLQVQKDRVERSVAEKRVDPIAAKDVEKRLVKLALEIRDLQADIASARMKLARLMGISQSAQFTLARTPIRPVLAALPRPEQVDVAVLEEYALTHRPELFERDLSIKLRRDDVRAAIISMFPGLSFSAARNFDNNRLLQYSAWNTAGASLSWNLLSLPSKLAGLSGRERNVELAKIQRMQLTVAVMTQVHIALLDYSIAADRFFLNEESYRLSNELLEMAQARHDAGQLSGISVAERLLSDMNDKLKRDQSVVDLIVAHRRLLTSIGLPYEQWDTPFDELIKPGEAEEEQVDLKDLDTEGTADTTGAGLPATEGADTAMDVTEKVPEMPRPVQPPVMPTGGGYAVQLGAYERAADARAVLLKARSQVLSMVGRVSPVIDSIKMDNRILYRSRFRGLNGEQARMVCRQLSEQGSSCLVVPPN